MGNDPSPSLLPFTLPLARSILPCEISQIGQTVVAPPNRRSQSVAAVQGDAKMFAQSQSQMRMMSWSIHVPRNASLFIITGCRQAKAANA